MYICLCRAVSHKTILEVIRRGARTVEQVADECRAGTSCGRCRESLEHLLDDVHRANGGNHDRR